MLCRTGRLSAPDLENQRTSLAHQARPRPTPPVLNRLGSEFTFRGDFQRRGPRLPPLSPGKPLWHLAAAVLATIPSFRTCAILTACCVHYSLSIFGQAFIVASRWAGLCQCPPTADAAFKVSELAKWPYIFNAAKILARYLLEDIYYGSR